MTSPTPPFKVLISGAGIAGSTLAYWLTRTPLNPTITILERSPHPRTTGQSVDVRGPAIQIIKDMHLEPALRAINTTETGTTFLFPPHGRPFAHFPVGKAFTADYEVLRGDLCALLLSTTTSLPNITHRYNDAIATLTQTPAAATVTFTSGAPPESYDLVVAADGSTSSTRSLILPPALLENSYKPLGQYLAFFTIPSSPSDTPVWHWYNTPRGLAIMTRPHRTPSTRGAYLCVTLPKRGARDPEMEAAMSEGSDAVKRVLRKIFEGAGWQAERVLRGMDQAEDFYMSRAARVEVPRWVEGRAVCVGDAAFATFGVGTTLAIESAYCLAGELGKAMGKKGGGDVSGALERYEEVFRRDVYKKMEDLPGWFPQWAFPQSRGGLWARNALLWGVSRTGAYRLFQGGSEEMGVLPEYEWVEG